MRYSLLLLLLLTWVSEPSACKTMQILEQWKHHKLPHSSLAAGGSAVVLDSFQFGLFRVYWAKGDTLFPQVDTNNNQVPDWIETIAQSMQAHWLRYQGLGFKMPPLKYGVYQVYVEDVGPDDFAYTMPDTISTPGDNPNTTDFVERNAIGSTIHIGDNVASWGLADPMPILKVTLAHEFLHALQFGYDAYQDPWLMESEATSSERFFYPMIWDNDRYLSAWFDYVETKMIYYTPTDCPSGNCATADHEYGIWPIFYHLLELDSTFFYREIRAAATGGDCYYYQCDARNILDTLLPSVGFSNLANYWLQSHIGALMQKTAPTNIALDTDIWNDTAKFALQVKNTWSWSQCQQKYSLTPIQTGGMQIIYLNTNNLDCDLQIKGVQSPYFALLDPLNKTWVLFNDSLISSKKTSLANKYLLIFSNSHADSLTQNWNLNLIEQPFILIDSSGQYQISQDSVYYKAYNLKGQFLTQGMLMQGSLLSIANTGTNSMGPLIFYQLVHHGAKQTVHLLSQDN